MLPLIPLRATPCPKKMLRPSVCFTLYWVATAAMGQSVVQQSDVVQQSVERVENLVAGLGAHGYLSRLKSEEAILQLGSDAIGPIKQAVNSPDIEISIRARRLLVILLERDFQQRRKLFLEAPLNSSESFGFLQWDAFAKLVGRTDRAKQLFVDIVQNQRDNKSTQTSSGEVSYLGYLATEQEQYTTLPASAVEVAQELFDLLIKLNSAPRKNDGEVLTDRSLTPAVDQPIVLQQLSLTPFEANLPKTLVKTVNESIYRAEIRALITAWIVARKSERGLTRNQVETIFQFELTQLRNELFKELRNERSKVRLQAAEAIAKTGGRDAVKMLLPFVRGGEVVVAYPEPSGGKSLNITLGDIVFQLILNLENQPLKDFGLLPTAGTMLLSESPVYGFVDRQSADVAIEKWESNTKR